MTMSHPEQKQDGSALARFGDLVQGYALEQDPEHLERLQDAILRSPNHDPMVAIDAIVKGLDEPEAVIDTLWRGMPGLFLSPKAHARLCLAYEAQGDHDAAQRERRLARLGLESIRSSGSGEEAAPYRVLRIEDEYDMLDSLGHRSRQQVERTDDRAVFDVHTVEEGHEIWFELLWRRADRS